MRDSSVFSFKEYTTAGFRIQNIFFLPLVYSTLFCIINPTCYRIIPGGVTVMVYNTILEAVGNTPMVRLNRMPEKDSAEILVKVEALNVAGPSKPAPALEYD
jgi:Cysteine synthase